MLYVKKVFLCGIAILGVYLLFCYGVAATSPIPVFGRDCLPQALKDKRHTDYPKGLRWIPWHITSWCAWEPPRKLAGNQKSNSVSLAGKSGPKPVPEPGTWQISVVRLKHRIPLFLPYAAYTTKNRVHVRLGCRWDDVDHYYVFPSIAVKKVR